MCVGFQISGPRGPRIVATTAWPEDLLCEEVGPRQFNDHWEKSTFPYWVNGCSGSPKPKQVAKHATEEPRGLLEANRELPTFTWKSA